MTLDPRPPHTCLPSPSICIFKSHYIRCPQSRLRLQSNIFSGSSAGVDWLEASGQTDVQRAASGQWSVEKASQPTDQLVCQRRLPDDISFGD